MSQLKTSVDGIVARVPTVSDANGGVVQVSGGIVDPMLPTMVPRTKCSVGYRWRFNAMNNAGVFDLGKMGIMTSIRAALKGMSSLCDPEIHVIWRSYCPRDICTSVVCISLEFNQVAGGESEVVATTTYPAHLFMHSVFYPKHAIRVGHGEPFPWNVSFVLPDANFADNYAIADVTVYLRGYGADVPTYANTKDSELISLVPLEEPVNGIVFNRPRENVGGWKMSGYKMAVNTKQDVQKILYLQSLGVDIEGLQISKKLKGALKLINNNHLSQTDNSQLRLDAAKSVRALLKN
ncbi:TPA_asm: protein 3 [Didymochlaena virus 1]|uniref:Protein 3 n=1 Tax=Didymochlaena virus 1 TaxID=2977966 RepID=A0A9N6YJ96_9RHAB|nr:TPA_asm: protein 3 [Didymochlaena virus 1]